MNSYHILILCHVEQWFFLHFNISWKRRTGNVDFIHDTISVDNYRFLTGILFRTILLKKLISFHIPYLFTSIRMILDYYTCVRTYEVPSKPPKAQPIKYQACFQVEWNVFSILMNKRRKIYSNYTEKRNIQNTINNFPNWRK